MDAACLRRHKFVSTDSMETYHISVIDYLQLWNLNKKTERFLKTVFLGKKGDELSAVEPVFYQERFFGRVGAMITIAECERNKRKDLYKFEKEMEARLSQQAETKVTSLPAAPSSVNDSSDQIESNIKPHYSLNEDDNEDQDEERPMKMKSIEEL